MQAAGIRRIGDRVEMIEVGQLRPLAGDEVLLEVRAAGVGNWNEFVRTGGWDVGAGEQLLVHGAGGVTGGLLVTLAMLRGAQVIATAGRHRLGELVTGARRMRAPAAFTSDPTIQPAYRAHNGLNRADH